MMKMIALLAFVLVLAPHAPAFAQASEPAATVLPSQWSLAKARPRKTSPAPAARAAPLRRPAPRRRAVGPRIFGGAAVNNARRGNRGNDNAHVGVAMPF